MDIKKPDRETLKSYFKSGAIPTESNFSDLIDGTINQKEDGLVKTKNVALAIEASGDTTMLQKVIEFYSSFKEDKPLWAFNLNGKDDKEITHAGLAINDGTGTNRLFIDQATGYIGIGTVKPTCLLNLTPKDAGGLLIGNPNTATEGYTSLYIGISAKTNGYSSLQSIKASGSAYGYLALNPDGGDIGIGTTEPKCRLDVKGAIRCGSDGTVPGLTIDQKAANQAALKLVSSGSGWGSGALFTNTASLGREWGVYSGADGNLHFANNQKPADIVVLSPDGALINGMLVIETSQGTWGFQEDGNLCFKNRKTGDRWCLNSNDTVFEKARKG